MPDITNRDHLTSELEAFDIRLKQLDAEKQKLLARKQELLKQQNLLPGPPSMTPEQKVAILPAYLKEDPKVTKPWDIRLPIQKGKSASTIRLSLTPAIQFIPNEPEDNTPRYTPIAWQHNDMYWLFLKIHTHKKCSVPNKH